MYERKIPKDLSCGMSLTMEIIGGKWKPCLLLDILRGVNRPSLLQRSNPRATKRVLNQQLRELEEHGMVTKTIFAELPLKVEYKLTERAISLIPVLRQMSDWGETISKSADLIPDVVIAEKTTP